MKLLVFAHKPPPHHGQSYMVQLLLEQLGGDARVESGALPAAGRQPALMPAPAPARPVTCYHVDCRLSDGTEDIGRFRWQKLILLLGYCAQAIWCRVRYGVANFLYVPAPGLRAAVYRDWIIMTLCRPFFRHRIYYWHAAGLAEWLETRARPWERWITRHLLREPDLSIVLSQYNRRDGVVFGSKRIACVPNAIADPCPRFAQEILPERKARAAARRARWREQPGVREATPGERDAGCWFQVLFMSLCLREKGLFDAVEAIALLNQRLRASSVIRARLVVAGSFWFEAEHKEFEERIRQPDLAEGAPVVDYRGFVSGPDKLKLFRESDCLCFPTYYASESFGLVLVEGMAHGLPLVATNWRMVPEVLPPKYPLVAPRAPEQIAARLFDLLSSDYDPALRQHFLEQYTTDRFAARMTETLLQVEAAGAPAPVTGSSPSTLPPMG